MVGICFPIWRLSPSSNDHARTVPWSAWLRLHRRREMHRQRDRADYTIRMIHEPDELAEVSLAEKVNDTVQRIMHVPLAALPALHEENALAEMVYDFLRSSGVPPFCSEIRFATTDDNPESRVGGAGDLIDLRQPFLFFSSEVNVALECVRMDLDAETFIQE